MLHHDFDNGNPVPSLNNEDMWLIKSALRYATTFDVSEREDFEKLLKKLENGVETDKEQLQECNLCIPKCEGCTQDQYDQAYTDAIDRGAIQDKDQFRKDWYENKPLI